MASVVLRHRMATSAPSGTRPAKRQDGPAGLLVGDGGPTRPVARTPVDARVPGEEFGDPVGDGRVGLGGGRLVELDGRSFDPVEAGHRMARPDQPGQRGDRVPGGADSTPPPYEMAPSQGTLRTMTTQWSPADDAVSTGDRSGPSGGPAVPDDEDETHRSAVDAVDGLLDEVERALARLDDGTYGRCESCGEPIGDDRLAVDPVVRTCAACEATADGPGDRTGRPDGPIPSTGTWPGEAPGEMPGETATT